MTQDYIPINYETWNFDGQGKNILDKLSPIEKKIWNKALPFQDTRKGETGHAEFVTYLALKLLDFHLNASREIVVPAAILHDIGWSQLTELERRLFYEESIDPTTGQQVWKRYEPILRVRHQEQGTKLSEKILTEVGYSPKNTKEVLDIISKHDTREGFLNNNEGIVRDADKLWRYTLPCFRIATEIRKQGVDDVLKQLSGWINQEGFFYSCVSKEIARIEINNTLNAYRS